MFDKIISFIKKIFSMLLPFNKHASTHSASIPAPSNTPSEFKAMIEPKNSTLKREIFAREGTFDWVADPVDRRLLKTGYEIAQKHFLSKEEWIDFHSPKRKGQKNDFLNLFEQKIGWQGWGESFISHWLPKMVHWESFVEEYIKASLQTGRKYQEFMENCCREAR